MKTLRTQKFQEISIEYLQKFLLLYSIRCDQGTVWSVYPGIHHPIERNSSTDRGTRRRYLLGGVPDQDPSTVERSIYSIADIERQSWNWKASGFQLNWALFHLRDGPARRPFQISAHPRIVASKLRAGGHLHCGRSFCLNSHSVPPFNEREPSLEATFTST